MKIVIAGASGFVGSHLVASLKGQHDIRALSRRSRESTDNIEWLQCDLFSKIDVERAVAGADVAIYLIHSMLPSARLTQGSFRDFDMILADNFSRACVAAKVKKIIYLSGIIPPDAVLSEHLQSRLEVENILKSSGIPVSCLRAGLIIGPGGSSFEMMLRLVRRLPMMICPYWTSTLSYPVSIWDVVEIVKHRVENFTSEDHETLDLCGPDALSYEEMMRHLSRLLKKNHLFVPIPFVSPSLSKLWVRLITGAPKDLVYPLVDSLKTHMIPLCAKAPTLDFIQPIHFDAALERSLREMSKGQKPNAFSYTGTQKDSNVRSVQRVTTLFRSDVSTVAKLYFSWLAKLMAPLVQVRVNGDEVTLSLRFMRQALLVMERSVARSSPDRQLFYIRGGLLVRPSARARLEFRDIYLGLYKIIAIHDYRPRLPWFFYKYTQALVHLWVMRAFGKYLIREKL